MLIKGNGICICRPTCIKSSILSEIAYSCACHVCVVILYSTANCSVVTHEGVTNSCRSCCLGHCRIVGCGYAARASRTVLFIKGYGTFNSFPLSIKSSVYFFIPSSYTCTGFIGILSAGTVYSVIPTQEGITFLSRYVKGEVLVVSKLLGYLYDSVCFTTCSRSCCPANVHYTCTRTICTKTCIIKSAGSYRIGYFGIAISIAVIIRFQLCLVSIVEINIRIATCMGCIYRYRLIYKRNKRIIFYC